MDRTVVDANGNSWTLLVRPNKTKGGNVRGSVVTLLMNNTVFMNPVMVPNKANIHTAIKELLRWVDKLGHNFPMASASRSRG